MATVTKTFVENIESSYASTWTVNITGTNQTVSDNFGINSANITARYVGSYKGIAFAQINSLWYYADGTLLRNTNGDIVSYSYFQDEVAWASGSTRTIPVSTEGTHVVPLANIFTSSNKTNRSVSITGVSSYVALASWSGDYNYWNEYEDEDVSVAEFATITLNAPPVVSCGTPTYATPQYAGLGAYSVPVTSATAQYGGDVSTITLTVGSDSATQNYATPSVANQTLSLVPSIAGTYTPTITVTDSRGQVTTVNLAPIIVNAYNAPNISFDIQRCTNIGKFDVEGEFGLVSARISYTSAIANLTQPTITVQDESGTTITSSAIWYTSWTAQDGVSNAVNWTNYNPQSPVTLYGVISATGSVLSPSESYIISVTPTDNLGGVATTITQTLPSSFFTIDFQAGGKEIAFGAVADDDVTNYPEGLFKCAMSFKLKDNLFWVGTRSEYEQAVSDDKMPEHTIVFITDETADYVVEEGTSGIWTYRKWNSGVAECWGNSTGSIPSGWSSSGITINLPFTFLTVTESFVQFRNWQVARGYTSITATNATSVNIQTNADSAVAGSFSVDVKGTWK